MKKIFLILLFFLLTGCSASYNLSIDEEITNENVSIMIPKEVIDKETIQNQFSTNTPVYNNKSDYYKEAITEDNNNYYINYSYNHKTDQFKDSKFINLCYDDNEIEVDNSKISFSTGKKFKCINMDDGVHIDNIEINITTKLKVRKNNADKVKDNTYTWIINEDNYQNKPINLEIKKPTTVRETIEGTTNGVLTIIIIIIFIVAIVVVGVIKVKQRKNNNF